MRFLAQCKYSSFLAEPNSSMLHFPRDKLHILAAACSNVSRVRACCSEDMEFSSRKVNHWRIWLSEKWRSELIYRVWVHLPVGKWVWFCLTRDALEHAAARSCCCRVPLLHGSLRFFRVSYFHFLLFLFGLYSLFFVLFLVLHCYAALILRCCLCLN